MQIGADPDSTIDRIKDPSYPDSPRLLSVPSPAAVSNAPTFCTCICLLCKWCCRSSSSVVPSGFYLPPQSHASYGKKTLVLDLDETLVHSSFQGTFEPDLVLPVEVNGAVYSLFVRERPGVRAFLKAMQANYELVVFSASTRDYANRVIDWLDKEGCIEGRLFREHCEATAEGYIKDLSQLGRDMRHVILLDVPVTQNSQISASYHPDNWVQISSYQAFEDSELELLYPLFQRLIDAEDVRPLIRAQRKSISQRMTIDLEDNRGDCNSPKRKFDSSVEF